ncbi:MAG TPA: class I SAM-dependent methyltransferase [Thermoanaerobaculia bacterium]
MTAVEFYDQLAPDYHLIFENWDASIVRQAVALDGLIRDHWGGVQRVLDAACGIGTQSIGLAQLGYRVTASDISAAEVDRARREASLRGVSLDVSQADMRKLAEQHGSGYDLVIACDNSVPHLLTDADILETFRQFRACLRPGGGCLITVRDYDREVKSGTQVKPYDMRLIDGVRYLVFQVWDFVGEHYTLSLYVVEDRDGQCTTRVMRTQYYAVGTDKLMALMREAGFKAVQRVDNRFYQPVILGTAG